MFFRRKRTRRTDLPEPAYNPPETTGKSRRPGQAALYDRIMARIREAGAPRHLLELGSGSGVLSLRIAQGCPELRVTGIEPASDRVRMATQAASEAGLGARVVFRHAELSMLPIPDASVDLLVGASVIGEARSPEGVLSEIDRVVAPGGIAVLVEEVIDEDMAVEMTGPGALLRAHQRPPLTESRIRRFIEHSPLRGLAHFTRPEVDSRRPLLEVLIAKPASEPGRRRR